MISTYTTNVVRGGDNGYVEFVNSKILHNHDRMYLDALNVPYKLTEQEFAILQKMFSNTYLKIGNPVYDSALGRTTERPLKDSSHPVAAFLNKFAYDQCNKTVSLYKNSNFVSMEIGSNYATVNTRVSHRCTYCHNSRDSARLVNIALRQGNTSLLATALPNQSAFVNKTVCNVGAQNCHFNAHHAFSINVNYDMPLEHIALIFQKHHLLSYDVWMFLPNCLIDESLVIDQTFFKVKIIDKKKISAHGHFFQKATAVFSLNDLSNCYVHDYATWKSYLTTTVIACNGFNIVSEIVENYGSFCHIKFTRCSDSFSPVIRVLPLAKEYSGFVIIPNIIKSINQKLHNNNYFEHYYVIPSLFCNSCIEYGTRQLDNRFDYNNFATWADSAKTNIIYAGGIIQTGYYTDPNNFDEVIQNLFIMCAVMRYRRTQQISASFKQIKIDSSRIGVIKDLINMLEDHFTVAFRKFCRAVNNDIGHEIIGISGDPDRMDNFIFSSINRIVRLRILVVPDFYTQAVYRTDVVNAGYAYVSELDFINVALPEVTVTADSTVGNCGFHALYPNISLVDITTKVDNFIKKFDSIAAKVLPISDFIEFAICKDYVNGNWLNINDLAGLCFLDGANLHLHQTGVHYDFDFGFPQWKSVNYSGHHFSSALCTCKPAYVPAVVVPYVPYVVNPIFDNVVAVPVVPVVAVVPNNPIDVIPIVDNIPATPDNPVAKNVIVAAPDPLAPNVQVIRGDYMVAKTNPFGYLYINCANESLTDGAGQAKQFREIFPGYDFNIPNSTIKTHNWDKPLFHKHRNYHLAICVAHSNARGNLFTNGACYLRLRSIFNALNVYAIANNLIVYLPLLGTALFRNPLSCFVSALSEFTAPLIVNCWLKGELLDVNTLILKKNNGNNLILDHDGFGGSDILILAANSQLIYTPVVYHPMCWESITDVKVDENRAVLKIRELLDLIKFPYNSYCEIGCAPGHMINHIANLKIGTTVGYNYIGPDALPLTLRNPAVEYLDFVDMNQINPPFSDLMMIDVGDCDTFCKNYHKYHRFEKFCSLMVIKCFMVDNASSNASFSKLIQTISVNHNLSIYRLKNSRKRSSELYVVYSTILRQNGIARPRNIDDLMNTLYVNISCTSLLPVRSLDPVVEFTPIDIVVDDLAERLRFLRSLQSSSQIVGSSVLTNYRQNYAITPSVVHCSIHVSVGGSGKTATIRKNMFIGGDRYAVNDCIISPIRHEKIDSVSEFTFHTFLGCNRKFRNIFIDEAFRFCKAYISFVQFLHPDSHIHLMGDNNQIHGHDPLKHLNDSDFVSFQGNYANNTTLRMPIDAALIASSLLGQKIDTKSVVARSVYSVITDDKFDFSTLPRFKTITHTNDQSNYLRGLGLDSGTIDNSQGHTYPFVNFVLSEKDLSDMGSNRLQYLYTAVSRHTRCLVVYGTSKVIDQILEIKGTTIDMTLELAGIPVVNDILISPKRAVVPQAPAKPIVDHCINTIQGVQMILNKYIAPTHHNLAANTLGIRVPMIARPAANRVVIPLTALELKQVNINGHRIANSSYCMYSFSKDKFYSMQSQIARYTKKTPKNDAKLFDGFLKFCKYDRKEIAANFTPKSSDLLFHAKEYLIALQKKFPEKYSNLFDLFDSKGDRVDQNELLDLAKKDGRNRTDIFDDEVIMNLFDVILSDAASKNPFGFGSLKSSNFAEKLAKIEEKHNDLAEFFPFSKNKIQFFMKKQAKYTGAKDFDIKFKAGQGVSAWSKVYNVFFSAFARYFNDVLPKLVKDNICIATGYSDSKLANFFKQYSADIASDFINVDSDFSEFDTSHGPDSIAAEEELYHLFSFNTFVIYAYIAARRKWVQINLMDTSAVTNTGEWYQHSGQPLTLISNTYFNMCVIGYVFVFEFLVYAAFKGDDFTSCCRAFSYTQVPGSKDVLAKLGYSLKVKSGQVAEFISYIITPCGLFPDLIRRTARVVSAIHSNLAEWLETRRNLADCLNVVSDGTSFSVGIQYAVRHYNTIGIDVTAGELSYLFSYLRSISTCDEIPGDASMYSTYVLQVDQ